MTNTVRVLATIFLLVGVGTPASALTIDFEEFRHGEIVYGSQGVGIRTTNTGRGPDLGVAFDTYMTGTRDGDLQYYSPRKRGAENGWLSGNLASNTDLGNILIIQENFKGCSATICAHPDDEGSRQAGFIEFDYTNVGSFRSFEMDLIDITVSRRRPEPGSVGFYLGDAYLREVMFTDFARPQVVFGNNSANRILFVKGLEFNRVVVRMGGSGGIDNVTTTSAVPEPSAAVLFLVGAMAVRVGVRNKR